MPKVRWIEYGGRQWRLSELARDHDINAKTLSNRIERGLPVCRALATGICSKTESGRRGFDKSWAKSRSFSAT